MAWDVEYTGDFERWWLTLNEDERESVSASVGLLEEHGPHLAFPHCSAIRRSRHAHMRELRIQHHGHPYRVVYAFDPRRVAILLIGGDKTGDDRWYTSMVPMADRLYAIHLDLLRREGIL
jgi:hypothetical protein